MRKALLSVLGAGAIAFAWLQTNSLLVFLAATKYGLASVSLWGLNSRNQTLAKLSVLGLALSGIIAGFVIADIGKRICLALKRRFGVKTTRIIFGALIALAGFYGFLVLVGAHMFLGTLCLASSFVGLGIALWRKTEAEVSPEEPSPNRQANGTRARGVWD